MSTAVKPHMRPKRLFGYTYKVVTPLGDMFVTINENEGKPFEVFAQIGRAGSDVAAFTEAIARLVSLSLRSGIDLEEVIKRLSGIGGSRQEGFGPNRVCSVPDALAKVLAGENGQDILATKYPAAHTGLCPECGTQAMVYQEGCEKYDACGYS